MNSRGEPLLRSYVVEEYTPPGTSGLPQKSPKPVVYLWGGNVNMPMRLEPPPGLGDCKIAAVACGRSQKSGVTDDGKLVFWEVRRCETTVGTKIRFPSVFMCSTLWKESFLCNYTVFKHTIFL